MGTETSDIIDILAGIEPGSSLDGIRARRLQARENAQKSYVALFEPADFGDVAGAERYAVAAFVAGVHDLGLAAGRRAPAISVEWRWERRGHPAVSGVAVDGHRLRGARQLVVLAHGIHPPNHLGELFQWIAIVGMAAQ